MSETTGVRSDLPSVHPVTALPHELPGQTTAPHRSGLEPCLSERPVRLLKGDAMV